MDHQNIYDRIIENAKSENRIKLKKDNNFYVYYENHHILPRCIGGGEDEKNKILLIAREHFICHKLLTYIYPKNYKICSAFCRMAFQKKSNSYISCRDYANAIELFRSLSMPIEQRLKISQSLKGKIISEKQKLLVSKTHKGKKVSKESIEKRKNSMKDYLHSEETKTKMSKSLTGIIRGPMTDEHKAKLRKANLGKKQSIETIEKRVKKLIGHPNWYKKDLKNEIVNG